MPKTEIRFSADGLLSFVFIDGEPARCPTQNDTDMLPIGDDMTDAEIEAIAGDAKPSSPVEMTDAERVETLTAALRDIVRLIGEPKELLQRWILDRAEVALEIAGQTTKDQH